ncbi:hypothetical protein KUTeg_004821 [Tegillarca granosa]|uniref:Nose resistant-to-fluoxetine protein N-terminal domain-containing protein n=1 Tax=Tegillarca granosa TaxID=220873 RepID=A0ABQ9FLU2_TEGGR|nr:hypothetical protein KUTeg_004821 [Tegillarca granosa]
MTIYLNIILIVLFHVCLTTASSHGDLSYSNLFRNLRSRFDNELKKKSDVVQSRNLFEEITNLDRRLLIGRAYSYLHKEDVDLSTVAVSFNVSELCLDHTKTMLSALFHGDTWALQMLDAMGKIPSDVLEGNLNWYGSFDECVKVQAVVKNNSSRSVAQEFPFVGKYCLANIPIGSADPSSTLGAMSILKAGMCLPSSCSNADAKALINIGPGLVGQILLSFSVYTNGKRLLSTSQPAGSLKCVHGIRFLSMTWVILGHLYICGIYNGANFATFATEILNRWTYQAIINALVSVDTFFTLSGLLMSFLVLKEMKKNNGKLNWFMYYFHRFWRLTPPNMLVMMVYVPLFPYFGTGPMWPQNGVEPDFCKDSWWTNLLYINNFLSEVVGLAVCGVMLVAVTITPGVISSLNNMPASMFSGQPIRINKYVNLAGWVIAAGVACAILYGLYNPVNGEHILSRDVSALYNATSRTVWGACVCWVIVSCVTGHGGFVNTILSWSALVPLSRLTYCAYLVHPVLMFWYYFSLRQPLYFTDMTMVYLCIVLIPNWCNYKRRDSA